MPFLFSAANSSGWFPQHQTPTFLPFIFAIVLIPLDFHVSSVMPLRAKTCATETIFAALLAGREQVRQPVEADVGAAADDDLSRA